MQVKSAKDKFLVAGLVSLLALGVASCKGSGNTNANNSNTAVVTAPTPVAAPSIAPDTALRNTVEANLTKYNVTGVTVEVSGGEVTLKGDIARAKLPDAMKAANEASPRKVNNQMNIK